MLAAMTHPSRVLNLDMKAKLCMPKSYIYISELSSFNQRNEVVSSCRHS